MRFSVFISESIVSEQIHSDTNSYSGGFGGGGGCFPPLLFFPLNCLEELRNERAKRSFRVWFFDLQNLRHNRALRTCFSSKTYT